MSLFVLEELLMEIIVRTHHVSITPKLKEYAKKKTDKLDSFFHNIQEIVIELDMIASSNEDERQIAKGIIKASGTTIRATEASKDMYASIDMLIEKLGKQLKKHKEKLKDHKHRLSTTKASEKLLAPTNGKKKIAKANHEPRYIPKPMMPEDAIILIEDQKHDFLVFRNAETEQINVIYPSKKGTYGLIET